MYSVPPRCALKLRRELDGLCLPSGEFSRGLAEPDIAQLNLAQHGQRSGQSFVGAEEFERRVDGHAQHVGDRLCVRVDR